MQHEWGEDAEFLAQLSAALGKDYQIDRLIGQGGFGRVYAGIDTRLGRSVAVKVIRPDLAGAKAFVERFRMEGTALAKFRHPGIVPIYDIREHQGLIYYVMPLIEGQTLRQMLDKRGKISPKETQRILTELCDCLAATHRAGIVHRDIKPDNVFLEGMLAKTLLMDFGVAKSMDDHAGATASGAIMGTPTYMSPEQAVGTQMDHRSDLYSVGVLGYHLLTGKPPFAGATAHMVIAGHINDAFVPIRRANPSVPKALSDAVEKCLAKNPDDRFQQATELSDALRNIVFQSDHFEEAPPARTGLMSFFAGMSLEAAVLAMLGIPALGGITPDTLWWLAGGFASLSVLFSPFMRATTEPLNESLKDRLSALRNRLPRLGARATSS